MRQDFGDNDTVIDVRVDIEMAHAKDPKILCNRSLNELFQLECLEVPDFKEIQDFEIVVSFYYF